MVGSQTTDTRWQNSKFFAAQIQIPIPNIYLGFGYKGLEEMEMENMDKGLHSIKIGADKLAENTPNAAKFICPKLSAQAQNIGYF